jgi:hypothetical protein
MLISFVSGGAVLMIIQDEFSEKHPSSFPVFLVAAAAKHQRASTRAVHSMQRRKPREKLVAAVVLPRLCQSLL